MMSTMLKLAAAFMLFVLIALLSSNKVDFVYTGF